MVVLGGGAFSHEQGTPVPRASEIEFFMDGLLVRIHCINEMILWTGLMPWEFELSFLGSFICAFVVRQMYSTLEPSPQHHVRQMY